MPTYTSYRVKGVLKPEYVDYIERFLKEYQWDEEDAPECIRQWHAFQYKNGSFKVIDDKIYYDNRIPLGLPSPWWGSECVMYEAYDIMCNENVTMQNDTSPPYIFSFSGELINKHGDIEFFMKNVMLELCSSIALCWICKEDDTRFIEFTEEDMRNERWSIL